MEELDLDIESYSLQELLNLFNIQLPITDLDIARAKRKLLRTHPDKSGLGTDVFIFFKSAYEKVKSLYEIQISQNREAADKYSEELEDKNAGIQEFSNSKNFTAKFNRLFEENIVLSSGGSGHGKWLANSIHVENTTSQKQLNELKKSSRTLSVVLPLCGFSNHCGSELIDDVDNSGVCGALHFEDVKRAYTESVVPVTEEDDFLHRINYDSVEELQLDRNNTVYSEYFKNHEKKLKELHERQSILDVEMAFKLQQQDEIRRQLGVKARGRLLQLQGK